jgi:phytoene synthase
MTLEQSYATCVEIAKTQARNFYYSFTVLPKEKRQAMCAIYAFMRHSDDLSDDGVTDEAKAAALKSWRGALDRALAGDYGDSPVLPAFHDTVKRYNIPPKLFHELIDGTEMDLVKTRYETFDEVYQYCYRVASVVGMVCIHVWGFDGGETAYVPAEACGIAFQMTNILRDVKEDAERGRIYLPLEDLRRFGYSEEDLLGGVVDDRFNRLMQFQCARAQEYYDKALPLIPLLHADGRPTFIIMYRIYRGLLGKIEKQGYDVFAQRARLSGAKKVGIVMKTWLGSRLPFATGLMRVG